MQFCSLIRRWFNLINALIYGFVKLLQCYAYFSADFFEQEVVIQSARIIIDVVTDVIATDND